MKRQHGTLIKRAGYLHSHSIVVYEYDPLILVVSSNAEKLPFMIENL
jgi:hypothetical protein